MFKAFRNKYLLRFYVIKFVKNIYHKTFNSILNCNYMVLTRNLFKNNEILSSSNFARYSDIVYSEIIMKKDREVNSDNIFVIYEDNEFCFYKVKSFNLRENDLIFSNLYMIESLFEMLKNVTEFKNIKIITGQSDEKITKKLFRTKPDCVSAWYSPNISYRHDKLIPIPLGLANNHPKNLNYDHFLENNENLKIQNKVYINFEDNTNYLKRKKIKNNLKNKSWAVIEKEKVSLREYLSNIKKYQYIISPEGNGIDTHRIWESLYAGSIPVVNKNYALESFDIFPIIFVNNLNKITIEKLDEYKSQLADINLEYFDIKWWIQKIKSKTIGSDIDNILVTESEKQFKNSKSKYHLKLKKERRIKKLKTLLRKILRKINY